MFDCYSMDNADLTRNMKKLFNLTEQQQLEINELKKQIYLLKEKEELEKLFNCQMTKMK